MSELIAIVVLASSNAWLLWLNRQMFQDLRDQNRELFRRTGARTVQDHALAEIDPQKVQYQVERRSDEIEADIEAGIYN